MSMDKQDLARTIYSTADELRGKIDASEYKNYVLGVLFYKFLSDKEKRDLCKEGWTEEIMKQDLNESDKETVIDCQVKNGYFISYDNLYSTWLANKDDFDISNVRDALNAFERLIDHNHSELFKDLFKTLRDGLGKLGSDSTEQTNNMRKLLEVLNDVPTDSKQDYDVLGFVYEYLLEQFASNSGKKAGEFYTPTEVSELMSVIVADHLKNREKITICDPTSGSGSLLLHIGKLSSETIDWDNIKYYAQDYSEDAYNLTRMNLIMKGVNHWNIFARNKDTLGDDWPLDLEQGGPLFVDAVVSNPPYSHKWTPKEDSRFSDYGLAPKSAADYAFLLHDLYHIKHDGIVAIVLPHGVLFRGNKEKDIRQQLVELNQIETIIGLPPNIFYNTSIETIIVILKKGRSDGSILFVNASKCFTKASKKNKLRAMDIKRISDAVLNRAEIPKFSRIVSKEEIQKAEYDLNIARYVDVSEDLESWDLRGSVCGGIPNREIDEYTDYWKCFPSLKGKLFGPLCSGYSKPIPANIRDTILSDTQVVNHFNEMRERLVGFDQFLVDNLVDGWDSINITKFKKDMTAELWTRLEGMELIDPYLAYQVLNDCMPPITTDIETLRNEGRDCLHKTVVHYVQKTSKGKTVPVPDGWDGVLFPKQFVLEELLTEEWKKYVGLQSEAEEIDVQIESIFEELDESWIEANPELFNDDCTKFDNASVKKYGNQMKKESLEEDSPEYQVREVSKLLEKKAALSKQTKLKKEELDKAVKVAVEGLTPEKEKELLTSKWVSPIMTQLNALDKEPIESFINKVTYLSSKYEHPLEETFRLIDEAERGLLSQLESLESSGPDAEAIDTLINLLKRE
ncbi:type I restriction system adenine methylase (hsdM) [Thermoplasmatales archaeon BRNA1]|nr:type I restriction system adenine methylase (hsdM) [Thermoplasmatales archaeon BRNA1]